MKTKNKKHNQFKSKGTEILTQNAPTSVEGFIKESVNSSTTDPQMIKPADPKIHKLSNAVPTNLGRLHIEIRYDLLQQLMQCVYQRKCDPQFKGRSTQRAVIEEALEAYFHKNSL